MNHKIIYGAHLRWEGGSKCASLGTPGSRLTCSLVCAHVGLELGGGGGTFFSLVVTGFILLTKGQSFVPGCESGAFPSLIFFFSGMLDNTPWTFSSSSTRFRRWVKVRYRRKSTSDIKRNEKIE